MNSVVIGAFQSSIIWEDKEKNINKLESRLLSAKDSNVDLVLLPEMSFTGFSMNTKKTGEDNPITKEKIIALCKRYDIAVGFGWVRKTVDSENHYTVIDKNGDQISDYVKIHPFSYSEENKHFIGGEALSFFKINQITFSTVICYDLRFPELFRMASRKADIVIVPANWPQKRMEDWDCLLKARAIENQIYVIGVNCVGEIGGLDYSGHSSIIAPDGNVLCFSTDEDKLLIQRIVDDVDDYRASFPTYVDKRPDVYKHLEKELVR